MSEDKSHAPTPTRLQKAREDGKVAVSRELSMLISLAAGSVAITMSGDGPAITRWLAHSLQQTRFQGTATWHSAFSSLVKGIAVPAIAATGAYAAATLLQTGLLFHTSALQPDLSRLSPLSGLKRIVGPQALVQLIKSLAKLAILGGCLFIALRHLIPSLLARPDAQVGTLYNVLIAEGGRLLLLLLGGQLVIAGADLVWERLRLGKQLRMTFQEVRDEHKASEGNPQIKHKIRQLARARAGRRMMQAVPDAAVVITNPTHFAVALTYQRGGEGAPRVVAKGADEVAARIREMARVHRVPIVANAPLARALYRVEVDTEIPAEHFRAVAEIIAYVWRMRAQAMRR